MKNGRTAPGRACFAESPNRVFMLFRGELPKMARENDLLPHLASISFPVAGLWRDATSASLPGSGARPGHEEMADGVGRERGCFGIKGPHIALWGWMRNGKLHRRRMRSNIIERWTQWDKLLRRRTLSSSARTTREARLGVDDNMQVIYRFTNDGKQLVQTIGTPEVEGADGTHFNGRRSSIGCPTGPSSSPDGYTGTRVAKFDKNGKFIKDWGSRQSSE